MSADPIYDGVKEGLGVFTYCRNNPLIYKDPTGLAIDLATSGKQLPITTILNEVLLPDSLKWYSNSYQVYNSSSDLAGYGYYLSTYTNNSINIYGHTTHNSDQAIILKNLLNQLEATQLFRIIMPPGYNFGTTDASGYSFGIHLHYEIKPRLFDYF
jgi:hypothetical protein